MKIEVTFLAQQNTHFRVFDIGIGRVFELHGNPDVRYLKLDCETFLDIKAGRVLTSRNPWPLSMDAAIYDVLPPGTTITITT